MCEMVTCGVDFCSAFLVWCMDMISLPHSSVEKAQKSTTCPTHPTSAWFGYRQMPSGYHVSVDV